MSAGQASVEDVIKEIVRTGKVVIGFRKTSKLLKLGKLKTVIVAGGVPKRIYSEITYSAKLSETPVIIFRGGSVDLGSLIGRPFPVSSIGVLDPGVVSLEKIREISEKV
ncbi:MAG: 50S ribosomal protein L30e [Sulfolobales archaeon]